MQRYQRHVFYLDKEKQSRLAKSRVTVVGLGGQGGFAVEILARIGVGRIRMVDGAYFQKSNLNREIFATEANLGQSKVIVAGNRINEINSQVMGEPLAVFMDEENCCDLVRGSDVVLDCLDNFTGKMLLFAACREEKIPMVTALLAGLLGQVATILPDSALGPDDLYSRICEQAGIDGFDAVKLPASTGIAASLQTQEVIKLVTHTGELLAGKTLFFDLGRNIFEVSATADKQK